MQYNQADMRVQLGDIVLMDKGQPLPFDAAAASAYLKARAAEHGTVNIYVSIGSGPGRWGQGVGLWGMPLCCAALQCAVLCNDLGRDPRGVGGSKRGGGRSCTRALECLAGSEGMHVGALNGTWTACSCSPPGWVLLDVDTTGPVVRACRGMAWGCDLSYDYVKINVSAAGGHGQMRTAAVQGGAGGG